MVINTYHSVNAWLNSDSQPLSSELTDKSLRNNAVCRGSTKTSPLHDCGEDVSGVSVFYWLDASRFESQSWKSVESGQSVSTSLDFHRISALVCRIVSVILLKIEVILAKIFLRKIGGQNFSR